MTLLLIIGASIVVEAFHSYSHKDSLTYTNAVGVDGNDSLSLMSYFGRVFFCHWRTHFAPEDRDRYIREENEGHSEGFFSLASSLEPPLNEPSRRGLKWFDWYTHQDQSTGNTIYPLYTATHIIFPIWPVAFLCVLPGLNSAMRVLRQRLWILSGRCPFCGYDVRATPERCPECGSAVKAPAVPGAG